jgi:hypothetical protein
MGGFGSGVRPGTVDPVLINDDVALEFFRTCGVKKLGYALVASSLRDIISLQDDPDAPDEIVDGAKWLESAAGREYLQFLVPGASADALIGRLQQDPVSMLQAFESARDDIDRDARACERILSEQDASAAKTGVELGEPERPVEVQRELPEHSQAAVMLLVRKQAAVIRQLELNFFDSLSSDAQDQGQPSPQAA